VQASTNKTSRIAIRLFSFNKILLFIKKLAFDGFYPLLVVLKNQPRIWLPLILDRDIIPESKGN